MRQVLETGRRNGRSGILTTRFPTGYSGRKYYSTWLRPRGRGRMSNPLVMTCNTGNSTICNICRIRDDFSSKSHKGIEELWSAITGVDRSFAQRFHSRCSRCSPRGATSGPVNCALWQCGWLVEFGRSIAQSAFILGISNMDVEVLFLQGCAV